MEGPYTSLLGMNWFMLLGIEVTRIDMRINKTFATPKDYNKVYKMFLTIFNGSLVLYKGPPDSLQLDPTVWPIYFKACRVPFTLKPKIDKELDWLMEQGSWNWGHMALHYHY